MEAYKNNSIFQGIVQYFDSQGIEWRREDNVHTHQFYKEMEGAFIYQGLSMRRTNKPYSIEERHQDFLESFNAGS